MPSLNFHVPICAICSKGHGKESVGNKVRSGRLYPLFLYDYWAANGRKFVSFISDYERQFATKTKLLIYKFTSFGRIYKTQKSAHTTLL
jgi:hypothetical protein